MKVISYCTMNIIYYNLQLCYILYSIVIDTFLTQSATVCSQLPKAIHLRPFFVAQFLFFLHLNFLSSLHCLQTLWISETGKTMYALDSPSYAHESADCLIKGPPGFLLRSQHSIVRPWPSYAGTRHKGSKSCGSTVSLNCI